MFVRYISSYLGLITCPSYSKVLVKECNLIFLKVTRVAFRKIIISSTLLTCSSTVSDQMMTLSKKMRQFFHLNLVLVSYNAR